MPNITFTATTTSQDIIPPGTLVRAVTIVNTGVNPVSIKIGEAGAAVYGAGVTLPVKNSSFSYASDQVQLEGFRAITSAATTTLSIFYI